MVGIVNEMRTINSKYFNQIMSIIVQFGLTTAKSPVKTAESGTITYITYRLPGLNLKNLKSSRFFCFFFNLE